MSTGFDPDYSYKGRPQEHLVIEVKDEVAPKKRLLFLDDRSRRLHEAIRRYSAEYDLTLVATVKEALRFIAREEWDIISLDFDLGGDDYVDPDSPLCGLEIVRYIEKTGWPFFKQAPMFWVHSTNPLAAERMFRKLIRLFSTGRVELRPFQYTTEEK